MESDPFRKTGTPLPVKVALRATDDGGLHTPVVPGQNFRPDMYLAENGSQFWGQLDFDEPVYPGEKVVGKLSAVFPREMEPFFRAGAKIELYYAATFLGSAEICEHAP